jgi:exonuclease VII small subunit
LVALLSEDEAAVLERLLTKLEAGATALEQAIG